MIDNLELCITSTELKQLVLGRVEYHNVKSNFFETEMTRIGTALEDMDDEAERIGKYSNSMNPVDTFKQKAKIHKDRATYFKFFADHLIPNETYRLTQNDLHTLEVTGR